jgi:hypothetical protein
MEDGYERASAVSRRRRTGRTPIDNAIAAAASAVTALRAKVIVNADSAGTDV